MADPKKNYLLGRGELLAEPIPPPRMRISKDHPYTFAEAKRRLGPKLKSTGLKVAALPQLACPNDEAVVALTLHPAYLAKGFYPDEMLNILRLRSVGSKPRMVTPEKWTIKHPPKEAVTLELFVAGRRRDLRSLEERIRTLEEDERGAADLCKVEDVRFVEPAERLRPITRRADELLFEVVLHADHRSFDILHGFGDFVGDLGLKVDLKKRFHAGGLCFLELYAPKETAPKVTEFSFLRIAREMPVLRPLRATGSGKGFSFALPKEAPLDPAVRAAVFDGGLPAQPDLRRWANRYKVEGMAPTLPSLSEHGLAVTSALLFGPLDQDKEAPRPYGTVDHYRVLDADSDDSEEKLFDVLRRIDDTLSTSFYEFVNLSIGPQLPIEDDEVHVWTAVLDQAFAHGKTLACIAVGNDGEKDRAAGECRIQSPSDCVNGLSIGSANSRGPSWKRAKHSSMGPGRRPGLTKPDGLAFGGETGEQFHVIDRSGVTVPRRGTSLASPTALRVAMGVRAHLGPTLTPLAIRALLVHRAEQLPDLDRWEIGWGRLPQSAEEIIICEPGTAHIIYQGELQPAQWLRAPIPVPTAPLAGMVEIGATFCFATDTDPQDPFNYTRSGLEIVFRPNRSAKKDPKQQRPDSQSFFRTGRDRQPNEDPERTSLLWETTLNARCRLQGKRLLDPMFDVHHDARTGGHKAIQPRAIPYALIVTVKAPRVADLYDQILTRYRAKLQPLEPILRTRVATAPLKR